MRWIMIVMLATACKDKTPPPEPSLEPKAKPIAVSDPGIKQAVDDVVNGPVEPVPAKDVAAKKDPAPVVGEWKIRTLQGSIDGKLSPPDEPIVPGSWVLGKDGSFTKTGGNELTGTFVFTGTHLIVSALGPALDYDIKKLTKTEMVLVQRIEGTTIENTTTFERKR